MLKIMLLVLFHDRFMINFILTASSHYVQAIHDHKVHDMNFTVILHFYIFKISCVHFDLYFPV